MNFTEFCASQNIKLQREDLTFIKKTLKHIPKASHKYVVKRYTEIWCKVRDATKRSVAAQNRGRYAANTWLRGIASGELVLDARGQGLGVDPGYWGS